MPSEELRLQIIDILQNLSPHLAEADSLIAAIQEGTDENLLQELSQILSQAADTVESENRSESLSVAFQLIIERRKTEEREREKELASASQNVDIDFP